MATLAVQTSTTPFMPGGLSAIGTFAPVIGLSRATVYRYVAKGIFPPPLHIAGRKTSRWCNNALNQWIADQRGGAV